MSPRPADPRVIADAPVVLLPESEVRLRAVRRRLGALLALYWAGLTLATAVERTSWQWLPHLEVTWLVSPWRLASAVLGAAPIGYFLAFALRRRRAVGFAAFAGAALGVVMEFIAWLGERDVIPVAVAARAASAAAGAGAFLLLSGRLRARAVNDALVLAPDLPLVGGAYVAAPLLWLASSNAASGSGFGVPWALVPLALYGASLIGSARASRGAAGGLLPAYATAAAMWALCGAAPLLPDAPQHVAGLALAAAVFAPLHPLLLGAGGRDRRVEEPALRRALPLFALYLLLAALGPLAADRGGRSGSAEIWASLQATVPAWSWTEQAAAVAVLGYATAELRGRREERRGPAWRGVRPVVILVAVLTAALRATADVDVWSWGFAQRLAMGVALGVLAGRAGFGMYDLQRQHARAHAIEGEGVRPAAQPQARAGRPIARSRRLADGSR